MKTNTTIDFKTNSQAVLDYLSVNGKITSLRAAVDLEISNLSNVIRRLKEKGYNISCDYVLGYNRYNRRVKYKEYFIKGE